jgi:hypothetical protein
VNDFIHWSISSGVQYGNLQSSLSHPYLVIYLAQYVTLQKYFSNPSLVIYSFFCTLPIKIETANKWELTNSKPLGPIIMNNQSEPGSSSQIIFPTLFSGMC